MNVSLILTMNTQIYSALCHSHSTRNSLLLENMLRVKMPSPSSNLILLFFKSRATSFQIVLLIMFLLTVTSDMTSRFQHLGNPVPWSSVSGNHVPMGASDLTSHSLIGGLVGAFTASSFRAWLRA
jgi:hypothetical protein